MKSQITIHRALTELKTLDERIEKAIREMTPVAIGQKDKKILGYMTIEEFGEKAKSQLQSVEDLIKRKTEIKSAIVDSNAKTTVKIGEKTYTVSEAITHKNIIDQKLLLLNKLQDQRNAHVAQMNKNNDAVMAKSEQLVTAALGAESKNANKETVNNISGPFLEANTWSLINPLEIERKIEHLEKEIFEFRANVDAVLSESNAITFITV